MQPGQRRWHEQLTFRNRLRAEPALATKYATLKARAADQHPHDREAYTEAKAEFIRRVVT
ncbi:MAG: GrpB family protein [Candidatus Dormibacteria bacterium]